MAESAAREEVWKEIEDLLDEKIEKAHQNERNKTHAASQAIEIEIKKEIPNDLRSTGRNDDDNENLRLRPLDTGEVVT
jgi:hypothetical protein